MGPDKRREGVPGTGKGLYGPSWSRNESILALVPPTTAFVPSAGEAALGTSTLREKRQQESSPVSPRGWEDPGIF